MPALPTRLADAYEPAAVDPHIWHRYTGGTTAPCGGHYQHAEPRPVDQIPTTDELCRRPGCF